MQWTPLHAQFRGTTPSGPPLTVSVDINCVDNCGSSQGTYTIHVVVSVTGGIGPYIYDPAQTYDVTLPHCTDGLGTVSVSSADGQTASYTWPFHDVSCPQSTP